MQKYAHLLIILPIFLLDRFTKQLVMEHLPYTGSLPVTSFVSIVHWRNKGGLFGFLAEHEAGSYLFLIIPLIVMVALAYYIVAYDHPFWSRLSLTFVLSGALGNIYDRILYGYVVDFIDLFYKGYHWPAFNVADASITFGIGLWLYTQLFLYKGLEVKKSRS
jgi:signal peptidase II